MATLAERPQVSPQGLRHVQSVPGAGLEGMLAARNEAMIKTKLAERCKELKGMPVADWVDAGGALSVLEGSLETVCAFGAKTGVHSAAYSHAEEVMQWLVAVTGLREELCRIQEDVAKDRRRLEEAGAEDPQDSEAVSKAEADIAEGERVFNERCAAFEQLMLGGAKCLARLVQAVSVKAIDVFNAGPTVTRTSGDSVVLDNQLRQEADKRREAGAVAAEAAAAKLGAHGDKLYIRANDDLYFGNSLAFNSVFKRRLELAVLDSTATVAEHLQGDSRTYEEKAQMIARRQRSFWESANRQKVEYGETMTAVAEVQTASWSGGAVRQHPEEVQRLSKDPDSMFAARYVADQGVLEPAMLNRFSNSAGTFGLSEKDVLPDHLMQVIQKSAGALKELADGDPGKELLSSLKALQDSAELRMAARMLASATAHIDSSMRILIHDLRVNELVRSEDNWSLQKHLERLEAEMLGLLWEQGQIARLPIARALDKFVRAIGAPHLSPMASIEEVRVGDMRKSAGFSKDLFDLVLDKCKEAKQLQAAKALASKEQNQSNSRKRGLQQQQQQQQTKAKKARVQFQPQQQQQQQQQQRQQQGQQQQSSQPSFSEVPSDASAGGGRGNPKGRGKGNGKGGKGRGRGKGN